MTAEAEEIKVGQDQIDAKTQDSTRIDEKLVESEEVLEDPEEFLAMFKETTSGTDAEWEEPQTTRQLEIKHAPRLWQS